MRAELKRLHSPDADIYKFSPPAPNDFSILVQAMIGYVGGKGEEAFNFVVCSPQWLSRRCAETDGPVFGVRMIIMNEYRYNELESSIRELCTSTTGEAWEEIAQKLSRYGGWEFADYKGS